MTSCKYGEFDCAAGVEARWTTHDFGGGNFIVVALLLVTKAGRVLLGLNLGESWKLGYYFLLVG